MMSACDEAAAPPPSPSPTHDLVFEGVLDSVPELLILGSDTGDVRRLLPEGMIATDPQPSPDGATIAYRYSSNATGSDIHLIAANGGASVPVTLAGDQRMPTWTPDGLRLVFVSQATTAARPDIHTSRLDGSDVRPLVTDAVPGGSTNPAFLKRLPR
ncbi:MAG: PD40 domain-containing protein [bacterium]|nr:PD40 domain-containing protein [bacterium]